ncbi:MAG: radical SAM protein [Desulfobacterales bacterium]
MSKAEHSLRRPKVLYIETTNRCNLCCKGCILHRGNWEPDRDMSLRDMVMITDQLPELQRVTLHGVGEPLLNEALFEMIAHLKRRNVYVLFNSNGILLDEKRQNAIIDTGLDELRISLDAASPQGYKRIRNSNKFNQIVQNLRTFVTLQKDQRAVSPRLSLWFLGTKDNIAELPDLLRLAADIGIGELHLQRLVYFQDHEGYGVARCEQTLQDSDDTTLELIHRSRELAARLGIQFNASGLSNPFESLQASSAVKMPWRKCYRPQTLMYITANGNVLPCCISPFSTIDYSSILLGNAFESSLAEIWSGPKYDIFRNQLQSETPPKCCRACGVLWSL